MSNFMISPEWHSLDAIYAAIQQQQHIQLSTTAAEKVKICRAYLDNKIANSDQAFYGINTGFGYMCNVVIPKKDISNLQRNLLLSHACGMGAEVPQEITRLMLLLKVQSLSYGYSGTSLVTVQRLIDFLNHGITPVVYEMGSLGASGDLAPLSHLSIPLIGEGKVYYGNKKQTSAAVLAQLGLSPIQLQSKEGLALINGTQFMGAYGVYCLHRAKHLIQAANFIAAMSIDAFGGHISPFYAPLHQIRQQSGQAICAKNIRQFLAGSTIMAQAKEEVQDPYSFRCVPQVHGASTQAIAHIHEVFENEINSVTDNPNIFVAEDRIVSGGNFHGQPLALSLDYLALSLSELGNISERRTYKLVGGSRGLPSALIADSGLNSGFMIPQYTAASLVSQNKQYCSPASADSITSSRGQEDHVSMGANAATKCYKVVQNLENILAIEFLVAAQALDFRRRQYDVPVRSSAIIEAIHHAYRKAVPFLVEDRYLYEDMQASLQFLRNDLPGLLSDYSLALK